MPYITKRRRRTVRSPGRRPEFAELEPRCLLAPAGFIPPPGESDGALLEPPIINSVDGVLKAYVNVVMAGAKSNLSPITPPSILYGGKRTWSDPSKPPDIPGPNPGPAPRFPLNYAAAYQFTTADGTVYPAQFPGPTLHVNPGDTLDLTIHNSLGTPALPFKVNPMFFQTNLHLHGLEVQALGDADNPYRVLDPGQTMHFVVQIPRNEPPGVDWYHPHRHMATGDQVSGGLAGALIIGDPLDPYPQYKGKFPERVLALSTPFIDPATRSFSFAAPNLGGSVPPIPQTEQGSRYDTFGGKIGHTWRKYVNGEFFPTLTIRPGQTEIWNIVGTQRNAAFNLGLTDAQGNNPWSATILAYDGNGTGASPLPIKLALPANPTPAHPFVPDAPMTVDPGARISVAVTAPTKPGTYYLWDNYTFANLPYFDPLDKQFKSFALATIKVQGPPVTTPPAVFPTAPLPPIYSAVPDRKRTFNFDVDTSQKIFNMSINGYVFPDSPLVVMQTGQTEQWTLVNPSTVDHPFHIHQNDFAVMSINGIPVNSKLNKQYPYVSLRDTVNIPAGGNVVVKFQVSPILGKYVFHCHILTHEDHGMMMPILVIPNADERRIALGSGPGQGGSASIQDGHGNPVGTVNPLPRRWKGGVATATGNLNEDLVQDIVAGPATQGSRGVVTIYDGKTLQPIKSFVPFPEYRRSGVSLAIGAVDGTANGDIIVGRVGPGPSLVRIFKPDGTPWRTLSGVIPGRLPNGVTVASSDFNGDNFDDIAIGGGKGSQPLVTGIDGASLSDFSGSKTVKLFSFTAPGGPRSGVNLAAGYFDPRTRPGFFANLLTTPASGRGVGTVTEWLPAPLPPDELDMAGGMPGMSGGGGGGGGGHMSDMVSLDAMDSMNTVVLPAADSSAAPPPQVMATFHPLGPKVRRGTIIAITRLGTLGIPALAAWTNKNAPVYQTINEGGVISTLQTPVT